ncbi:hypothetical protein LRS74_22010 [Streptomyces sp. LX-29]|uniref:hypothetical protein n=1 Tax=Streptomyces sp. LX-29 TaxID=2900152 RepID=UPI00240D65F6|nr:hypothetical protein [Streptomyces sp. LX-29]WFB09418.1 hypothetical protein LRS74_22010 [Streptomyces sp. LX-29]
MSLNMFCTRWSARPDWTNGSLGHGDDHVDVWHPDALHLPRVSGLHPAYDIGQVGDVRATEKRREVFLTEAEFAHDIPNIVKRR